MAELRVIDAGTVSAARSQYLWHGIASAMAPDAGPVLSLCRPAEPYVCIGYHRALDEVDCEECERRGWPVLRRRIGGGPVYVDGDQLFFQLTMPAERAPARVDRLYERLLGPAVAAFEALGLAARLDGTNDLAVAGRKVSGTGAGRIGDAVTVVGNVIFRFPHERMAAALRLPSESLRGRCLELMRRHVSSLELEGQGAVSVADASRALMRAYGDGLGLRPVEDRVSAAEAREIERWEARATEESWLAGQAAGASAKRWVKIREGVWVYFGREDGVTAEVAVVDGALESVTLESDTWNGAGDKMSRALTGQAAEPEAVRKCLAPFGEMGLRAAELVRPGLELR